MNKKIIFILIDGIADIEKVTCLDKANIPTIDLLAKSGINGIMDPVETGLACGSDTAHMNIFGYNPFQFYKGRGSFEVMGSGIPMEIGEIGFKCNFAYMDENTKIVTKRRADRHFAEWGLELIKSLNGNIIPDYPDYKVSAQHATEHRIGVKIQGKNLDHDIEGTDPLKDNLKLQKAYAVDSQNKNQVMTADIINKLSDQIHILLKNHQINIERQLKKQTSANIVLLRGCGARLDVDSFQKQHGLKAFMIAPTAIIAGLGLSLDMDIIDVEGATGDYNTNLMNKAKSCVESINKDYDFGFLHIKAVDDCGHDKDSDLKINFFQKIDEMVLSILDNLTNDYVICITGDHTTPCIIGDHTFEPVPILITTNYNYQKEKQGFKSLLKDEVKKFTEIECASGLLGRFPASQLINLLKNVSK